MMFNKPLIGITLDFQQPGGYSQFAWYALRCDYFRAVEFAGGVPVAIPYCKDVITDYLQMIDGLIIPGGDHDIDPADYGDSEYHPKVVTNAHRTKFDYLIMRAALDVRKPLLAICAGHQLLNVVLGGSLIQHIPDYVENALEHMVEPMPPLAEHPIAITTGTLLHEIIGQEKIQVNTHHHQAIRNLGDGLVVNAVALDGIIEGIELPNHPFCLGVQWHPEFIETANDQAILKRFINAASQS